jgi:hypothetical protein
MTVSYALDKSFAFLRVALTDLLYFPAFAGV